MPALFLEYSPGFTSSVMKIFTSSLTMAAPLFAVVRLATATATVFNCLVTHNSQGNLFVIQVQDIPDVSQSTICGQSALDIGHSAEAFSVNVVGGSDDDDDDDGDGVQCNTDDDAETMALSVTFDKQPPNVQLDALVDARWHHYCLWIAGSQLRPQRLRHQQHSGRKYPCTISRTESHSMVLKRRSETY
jgi:hypothetical protein